MKKLVSLGLVALLSACSTVATNQVTNQNVTKLDAVSTAQLLNNQSNAKQQVFLAEVSKEKGASFSVSVNINSGFNVKNNTDGVLAKGVGDINKVDVYLLSLPSGFSGTNPLGVSTASNVVKSFTGTSALSKTGANFTITFQGVPGLATPNQYWVGIVAKDSTGNVINKAPSTPWTLDTLTGASNLSLSSSGVGVDATTLAVSTPTALTLALSLNDAVGAKIEAGVSSTAGTNTLSNTTVTAS